MANSLVTQTLVDGDKNVVVLCLGTLDTSNLASTLVIDVSALAPAATDLLIEKLSWSVSSGLQLLLWWDATTDDLAFAAHDAADAEFCRFGGLKNPRSTGWTGDLNLTTLGYSAGTVTFSLLIEATKRGA